MLGGRAACKLCLLFQSHTPWQRGVLARCQRCTDATRQCLLRSWLPPGQVRAAVELLHAWLQHAVRMCPLFCFCLRKGWLPPPCHPHSHPSTIPFPDPGNGIHSLFRHTWINLSLLCVSQQFPHFLPSCSFFISEDIVSPAIYFNFLHEVQLREAFEHFRFISAFSDLWDLTLLTVSSFSIRGRFLLTLKHFL